MRSVDGQCPLRWGLLDWDPAYEAYVKYAPHCGQPVAS